MRVQLLFVIVGAALTLGVPPALAARDGASGHGMAARSKVFVNLGPRAFLPHRAFRSVRLFHRFRRFDRSGGLGFADVGPLFPTTFSGGFEGFDGSVVESRIPPILVLDTGSLARAAHSTAEARGSLETTPQGVVIIRGPGTRHAAR